MPRILAALLASSLLASAAIAGPFSGDWLPDTRTCVMTPEALDTAVTQDRQACKAMARASDDRQDAFQACMVQGGWLLARGPVDPGAVTGGCHDESVTLARLAAVEGLRPASHPVQTRGALALR